MALSNYIINDVQPLGLKDKVKDAQEIFNQLTFSHMPVRDENGTYIGCISETDAHCFDSSQPLEEVRFSLEAFHVNVATFWLDILESFALNDSNIMPVLNEKGAYLGYYELNDIMSLFHDTPFLSEAGAILVVEKGYNDYSFSEIVQIVESNNAKLFGAFISKIENDLVQVTIKIGHSGLNEILQTFRRYSYNIITGHGEDLMLKSLKDRSDYLNKYLNL